MTCQIHHLIPEELSDNSLIVDLVLEGLFDIQSENNKIGLSEVNQVAKDAGQAVHRGSHPAYTDFVTKILNQIDVDSASLVDAARANSHLVQLEIA